MADTKMIYVRGNRDDGRVALSEVDDAHPGGSVFIAHRMARKVALTPFVADRLREGALVETSDAADRKQADEFVKKAEEMAEQDRVAATGVTTSRYDSMSQKELAEEAKNRGLNFEGRVTKKDVISALEADDARRAGSSVMGSSSGGEQDSNSGRNDGESDGE